MALVETAFIKVFRFSSVSNVHFFSFLGACTARWASSTVWAWNNPARRSIHRTWHNPAHRSAHWAWYHSAYWSARWAWYHSAHRSTCWSRYSSAPRSACWAWRNPAATISGRARSTSRTWTSCSTSRLRSACRTAASVGCSRSASRRAWTNFTRRTAATLAGSMGRACPAATDRRRSAPRFQPASGQGPWSAACGQRTWPAACGQRTRPATCGQGAWSG